MLGHERVRTDDTVTTDHRVAENRRADADEAARADPATMHGGGMAYRDARLQQGGRIGVDVHDGVILNVTAFANRDRGGIGSQHRAEPDTRIATELDATDHGRIRCNEECFLVFETDSCIA